MWWMWSNGAAACVRVHNLVYESALWRPVSAVLPFPLRWTTIKLTHEGCSTSPAWPNESTWGVIKILNWNELPFLNLAQMKMSWSSSCSVKGTGRYLKFPWCVSLDYLVRLRTCSGPPQVRRLGASRLWPSWWRPAVQWRGRARRARARTWSGTGAPRAWWSILSVDINTHDANNYISATESLMLDCNNEDLLLQTFFFLGRFLGSRRGHTGHYLSCACHFLFLFLAATARPRGTAHARLCDRSLWGEPPPRISVLAQGVRWLPADRLQHLARQFGLWSRVTQSNDLR